MNTLVQSWRQLLVANNDITRTQKWLLAMAVFACVIMTGYYQPLRVVSNPTEIYQALVEMWNDGLIVHVYRSAKLALAALFFASLVALPLGYVSTYPIIRLFVQLITKFRFLSLLGLYLTATVVTTGGFAFKLLLLVAAISVFLVTSVYDVVASIPTERFDHARALGLSKIGIFWHVVVRGTTGEVWDAIVQNGAIGFSYLTIVEGFVRSQGGIGVLLRNAERFLRIDQVWALQLVLLVLGFLIDTTLTNAKRVVVPHAYMKLQRK